MEKLEQFMSENKEKLSEITKIFEHWYMSEIRCAEENGIAEKWIKMEEYVMSHLDIDEVAFEDVNLFLHKFTTELEKTAFVNGYKKAFKLYLYFMIYNISNTSVYLAIYKAKEQQSRKTLRFLPLI